MITIHSCRVHGPQQVERLPAMCPECAKANNQTLLECENHGPQVIQPGKSCSFCVMEDIVDKPMHRVQGRENAPTISYFKPKSGRRAKS